MDCAETRSTRSDRKRHRSRAERSEAELGHLKRDYLCRTVVVERVDLFDANIARIQEILRALEVDADVEKIAAVASRARAEGRPAKKQRRAADDASFVPRRAPARAPGKAPARSRARAPPPRPRSASAAVPTGAAARRKGKRGRWTDLEERLLLDAMQAAGVVESGKSRQFFAETARHLFGRSRSTDAIAQKVQALLINGPRANKTSCKSGGSGTSGMRGVSWHGQRSKSASLPLSPAMLAPPTPNKSNCVLEGPRPALPTSERDTAGRWRAQIKINGNKWTLGRYTDAYEAARARDRCVRRALPPEIQRLCRPRGGRPPQPFPRMRRASLAVLGAPAFGSTFAQLFNDADAAAALVAADGELQPPPESSHANIKKLYRANAKAGVTRLHPGMLELWRLHMAAPVAAMPVALPVTAAFSANGAPPTAVAWAAATASDDEEGPRALPPAKTAPPLRGAWRAMLGLTLPGASR